MAQLRRPAAGGRVDSARRRTAGAAGVPLVLFLVLLLLVQGHWLPLRRLDGQVSSALHRYAVVHHGFVLAMKAVSSLGTSASYAVLAAGLLGWLLRHRRVRAAAFVVVAAVGGTVLNSLVKGAVGRPRPLFADPVAHAAYSSFPSGHAQGVAVAAGIVLLLLLPGRAGVRPSVPVALLLGWTVLMAFSRVALGVHYVSDVLAGLALGAAWLLGCLAAFGPTQVLSSQ